MDGADGTPPKHTHTLDDHHSVLSLRPFPSLHANFLLMPSPCIHVTTFTWQDAGLFDDDDGDDLLGMEEDDSGHADRILESLPSEAQELVQVRLAQILPPLSSPPPSNEQEHVQDGGVMPELNLPIGQIVLDSLAEFDCESMLSGVSCVCDRGTSTCQCFSISLCVGTQSCPHARAREHTHTLTRMLLRSPTQHVAVAPTREHSSKV